MGRKRRVVMIEILILLIGIVTGLYGLPNFFDGVIDNDGVYTIEFLLGMVLPIISIVCFINTYATLGIWSALTGIAIIIVSYLILGLM
jgi:uncharacterized membrane protein